MIGTGYVGLCTGVGFALKGHRVICVDIDDAKVDALNSGKPIIYEEGLEDALKRSRDSLSATTSVQDAVTGSEISFLCVGTPDSNGEQDLTFIKKAAADVGDVIRTKDSYHLVVVKSTVLPKTTENVIIPILEEHSDKKAGADFGVCSNPEFLREGKALEDFLQPERIVIGEIDKTSGDTLERIYRDFNAPILRTDLKTAEMIKYGSNAFFATKISFVNELGNICKLLGIDSYTVAKGLGYDKRIAPHFLDSGAGFGGSCLPKDMEAIIKKSKELDYDPILLENVLNVNKRQRTMIIRIIEERLGSVSGKKIAVLGLAFKPGTDDIREAVSTYVISELLRKGARISAYDPKAENNMKAVFPDIEYHGSPKGALDGSECCVILTEWPEFSRLTDESFSGMKRKLVVEGRRILDSNKVSGFEGICW